jgi:NADPH-dependent 2,4-dienoyl-CoA reductase/sulfur reductase-like enzyme
MSPQNNRYLAVLTAACCLLSLAATAFPNDEYDVLIYGATPGGIAAALASGKAERSVLLVEPTHRIGGMTASGLSHPDFRTFEALTGTYLELVKRTLAYYEAKYGP